MTEDSVFHAAAETAGLAMTLVWAQPASGAMAAVHQQLVAAPYLLVLLALLLLVRDRSNSSGGRSKVRHELLQHGQIRNDLGNALTKIRTRFKQHKDTLQTK